MSICSYITEIKDAVDGLTDPIQEALNTSVKSMINRVSISGGMKIICKQE
jgi:hypothetical protein